MVIYEQVKRVLSIELKFGSDYCLELVDAKCGLKQKSYMIRKEFYLVLSMSGSCDLLCFSIIMGI